MTEGRNKGPFPKGSRPLPHRRYISPQLSLVTLSNEDFNPTQASKGSINRGSIAGGVSATGASLTRGSVDSSPSAPAPSGGGLGGPSGGSSGGARDGHDMGDLWPFRVVGNGESPARSRASSAQQGLFSRYGRCLGHGGFVEIKKNIEKNIEQSSKDRRRIIEK